MLECIQAQVVVLLSVRFIIAPPVCCFVFYSFCCRRSTIVDNSSRCIAMEHSHPQLASTLSLYPYILSSCQLCSSQWHELVVANYNLLAQQTAPLSYHLMTAMLIRNCISDPSQPIPALLDVLQSTPAKCNEKGGGERFQISSFKPAKSYYFTHSCFAISLLRPYQLASEQAIKRQLKSMLPDYQCCLSFQYSYSNAANADTTNTTADDR